MPVFCLLWVMQICYSDLNKVYGGIGDKLGALVQWTTTFFGGLVVGLIVEWRLALVMIGVTPITGVVAGLVAKVSHFVLQF